MAQTKKAPLFAGTKAKRTTVLAGRDKAAHGIFGGKTLKEVAEQLKLTGDNDVDIVDNGDIVSLLVVANGKDYIIPISRGLINEIDTIAGEDMAACEFRINQSQLREPQDNDKKGVTKGDLMVDDNGDAVLGDYLTFGKPGGTIEYTRRGVFAEATPAGQLQTN